jgi:hypothetical protein
VQGIAVYIKANPATQLSTYECILLEEVAIKKKWIAAGDTGPQMQGRKCRAGEPSVRITGAEWSRALSGP